MDRVYIIKAKMHDTDTWIYKCGKSSGKSSVDRMLQLAKSFFTKYRYIPLMTVKRDRPAPNAFEIETTLHRRFKEFSYYHDKNVDGATEWFVCPEHELLRAYDELLPTKGK